MLPRTGLGAGPFDQFRSVVLPLARRSFVTAASLGFAHTVGEFGVVLMIGGNIPGETQVAVDRPVRLRGIPAVRRGPPPGRGPGGVFPPGPAVPALSPRPAGKLAGAGMSGLSLRLDCPGENKLPACSSTASCPAPVSPPSTAPAAAARAPCSTAWPAAPTCSRQPGKLSRRTLGWRRIRGCRPGNAAWPTCSRTRACSRT